MFIRNFDRFFDCLNVRSSKEAVYKRKPDLRPYRDPCDPRLTVSVYAVAASTFYFSKYTVYLHSRHDISKSDSIFNMHMQYYVLLVVGGWISGVRTKLG